MHGADAAKLTQLVEKFMTDVSLPATTPAAVPAASLDERLRVLIQAAPVMVFIKGTADQPQCGFSRQLVALLRDAKAEFSTFDILADDEV